MVATAPREVEVRVKLRGGNWTAYHATDPEVLVEGPTGTGKTWALLLRRHKNAQENPGYRGLIVRKTAVTLSSTILRTFEEEVLHEWDRSTQSSELDGVHYFGGSQHEPAAYVYENGSRIVVGGMDSPSKVLGTDYDEVYFNEVTEGSEEDVETLLSRLRHGVLPQQQLIMDCNPTYDRHWVLKRCQRGQTRHIKTTLKDNPAFYDDDGNPTPRGEAYLRSLSGLTGTRYQRLVLGEWVGMENAIYADALKPEFLVELPERPGWTGRGAGGMDFGRVHFSAVLAATEDHAGRLWVRECWTGHNSKQEIMAAAERHRTRYKIPRSSGVTDPLQDWAAQDLGWRIAKSGAGSRKGRIQRVRAMLENGQLMFDRYGEGVQDLWDELHMYRYEVVETDTNIDDVVVRKDDDRVAALEYAIEAWMLPRIEFGEAPERERRAPLPQRAGTVI